MAEAAPELRADAVEAVAAAVEAPLAEEAAAKEMDPRTAYIEQLRAEAKVYPQVPDVEVKYDFCYDLQLPASQVDHSIPTVVGKFRDLLLTPLFLAREVARIAKREPDTSTCSVSILKDCKGALRPGTMTLLLAPPGHGKTTLLKAMAGRLPTEGLTGSITFSGLTQKEVAAKGMHLKLLANYVDQLDVHLPFLTVRETAEFACLNSTVEPAVMGEEMLTREAANRVERVIKLLNLSGCADTLVGNNLVRGVSGGEKKRVTIAEALVSNARLLCMDEISTGLDASVTYDICASIRAWAHEMRGTVIIALLQPTPEVYNLFDDILLMREGSVVYHGARKELPGFLSGLGFTLPGGGGESESADIADWLVELLASPTKLLKKQVMSSKGSTAALAGSESSAALLPSESSVALDELGKAPRTTAELSQAWLDSEVCKARVEAPPVAAGLELVSGFAKQQYGRSYPRSGLTHFEALLKRQFLITIRNSLFVTARILSSVIISVILGLVWFDLSMSQGLAKFGMLLFCVLQVAFANFSETPFAVEYKYIAYKQIQAGMYPPWAYTLSGTIVQVPTAAIESAAFSVILYFMVGLVNDGGRWAFFYLVLWLINVGIGSLFRFIAYVVPTYEAAQTAPGPFIAIQVIFAGFLIPPNLMGTVVNGTPWLIFLYYSSVFAYALRSLAQNEFYSPPYSIFPSQAARTNSTAWDAVPMGVPITELGSPLVTYYYTQATCDSNTALLTCGPESYGTQSLMALNINLQPEWKWGGVGFLLFFLILSNVISGWALAAVQIERNIGTSRTKDEDEPGGAEEGDAKALPSPAEERAVVEVSPAGSVASVLPFTPMTVTWRDVKYTVQLNANLGGGSKTLLQGVSGIAVPGRLISLMGASGAGKSTLLDVIAGRKTAGKMEGKILLNGFQTEAKSFARLTAYCEQQDIHNSFATVREALSFSAALRLSRDVSATTREAFVEEVMDLLELRSIANRMIGEVGAANGLAPGQRKILTIGVELVSNAPILFLDEPTSGLDARAAAVVIREVRKITDTGRTVLTTIHQPSADVFFKFDEVLLMQRGGYMAYFGPVGRKGAALVAYMEAIPGVHRCPRSMNPASWMLDVLAGTDSSAGHAKGGALGDANRASMDGPVRASVDGRGSIDGAAAGPDAGTVPLDGQVVQQRLMDSEAWKASLERIDAASVPAEGSVPHAFDSMYARTFPEQLAIVLGRANRSYNRNTGYVYTKTMVLWGLLIMFGVIYYKVQSAVDCAPATGTDSFICKNGPGGVQAVVSVVFLTTLFIGILSMNTMLPVLIRERAVFYRERSSYMYAPEAHSLSYALIEIPWLIFLIFLILTGFYFMVGFSTDAGEYFFYMLGVFMLTYVFISLGQWAAAYFPTAEVAQAVIGLVIPLAFLFGGLYLPKPQIPNGEENGNPGIYWLWAYYIDPISYALEALVPARFADMSRPSTVNHTIVLNVGGKAVSVDAKAYVTELYDAEYKDRWPAIGCLAAFVVGLQACHLYATRYKQHIDR